MQQAQIAQADAPEQVPGFVIILRAAIRPLVTLALTGAFILLLFKGTDGAKDPKEMLTVLLAVYGPIVGFWFGQQAVLKQKQ